MTVWQFSGEIEAVDYAVGGADDIGDLLSFIGWHVEHLHAPGSDLHGVIVPVLVPIGPRDAWPGKRLGHDVLHLREHGVGVGVVVDEADDLWLRRDHLAVVMEGSHNLAVHYMRSRHVDVVALSGARRRRGILRDSAKCKQRKREHEQNQTTNHEYPSL